MTDELRLLFGLMWGDREPDVVPIGSSFFSADGVRFRLGPGRWDSERSAGLRERFSDLGCHVLSAMPGGREELRQLVHPDLVDLVDGLQPRSLPVVRSLRSQLTFAGSEVASFLVLYRIDTEGGDLAGVCFQTIPAVGMSQLTAAAAIADVAHLERMRSVEIAGRRQAAVLMADLEASSPLARGLSSAQYFAFGRRLVRAADRCVIDAGGLVGRHAGDGIVAFFLAEELGSESAAARSCIEVARTLREVVAEVAVRSEIPDTNLSLRFGLHWGATLYVGRIHTPGRSEVNALGDEMNETARIEACAAGGRTLVSKDLIERLDSEDAAGLGIDPRRTKYTQLGELTTATEKARRDAPSIPVCDVTDPIH